MSIAHTAYPSHKVIGLKVIEIGMNINWGCGERENESRFLKNTFTLTFQDYFYRLEHMIYSLPDKVLQIFIFY